MVGTLDLWTFCSAAGEEIAKRDVLVVADVHAEGNAITD